MDPGFDQLELGQAVNRYMHSELHNVIFIHYVLHCFKIRQKMFKSGVFLDKDSAVSGMMERGFSFPYWTNISNSGTSGNTWKRQIYILHLFYFSK